MPEGNYLYCDVSLPVPLDQPFTYSLPDTLRHRVRAGSRLVVPFGTRKLTGVILRCHDQKPEHATRDALRLLDSEPVLSPELLALGRWISGYYCSPLGDVLRGMLPLGSEIRQGKVWTLTDAGRDAARQLLLDTSPDDPVLQVLRMLEKRPLSGTNINNLCPFWMRPEWNNSSSMMKGEAEPVLPFCAKLVNQFSRGMFSPAAATPAAAGSAK